MAVRGERDATSKGRLFAHSGAGVEGWGGEAVVDIDSPRVAEATQVEVRPLPLRAAATGDGDEGQEQDEAKSVRHGMATGEGNSWCGIFQKCET